VFGPSLLNKAVLIPGIALRIATVLGQAAQVLSTQTAFSGSNAGKVWRNGNTFQSLAPPSV
jgi:hypothetical protein